MKRKLLSVLAVAIATVGFSQTNSATSGNTPNSTGDGYVFEFNGNAGANCTSETANEGNVKTSWNAKSTSIDTNGFANGQAILTVDTTTAAGWSTTDGFTFIFSEENCSSINLDLSQNDSVEIKITSSVAVPYFYIALGDTSAANIADEAIFTTQLTTGEQIFKFEVPSWKTWNGITVDSTHANYILMGFREGGYGTAVVPGTYTIDYIKVGNQEGLVGLEEAEEVELSLYPNPATDYVNLGVVAEQVSIYNVNGTEVLSEVNVEEVNVSSLKKGVYIIQTNNRYGKFIKE